MVRARVLVALALAVSVPSCATVGVSLGAAADSPGLTLLGATVGLIGDSFLVKPLDGEVDHDTAWLVAMGVDLIVIAVLYKAVYHGHQAL